MQCLQTSAGNRRVFEGRRPTALQVQTIRSVTSYMFHSLLYPPVTSYTSLFLLLLLLFLLLLLLFLLLFFLLLFLLLPLLLLLLLLLPPLTMQLFCFLLFKTFSLSYLTPKFSLISNPLLISLHPPLHNQSISLLTSPLQSNFLQILLLSLKLLFSPLDLFFSHLNFSFQQQNRTFSSATCLSSLPTTPTCNACQGPIIDPHVAALNAKWHKGCFVCHVGVSKKIDLIIVHKNQEYKMP